MCSLSQVRPLTVKRPPHPQPSMTTGHPVTTWTPSCSSSARWPGRGTSSASVWRWHRPGPPSTTAGANPVLPANLLSLLLFFSSFLYHFLWTCQLWLELVIYLFFLVSFVIDQVHLFDSDLWFISLRAAELMIGDVYSLWFKSRCQCSQFWLPCFHLLYLCCL